MTPAVASPVSCRVSTRHLPKKGMPVTLVADETQRRALAGAHGLVSVEAFQAKLTVHPWKRDGVRVSGTVKARVVQSCVVTLDPLTADIDEPVSALFVPQGSKLSADEETDAEILIDAEGPDAPEPFEGEFIDVGALAEEWFELAIDPYPRKPGTGLETPRETESSGDTAGPMYAALRKLRVGR